MSACRLCRDPAAHAPGCPAGDAETRRLAGQLDVDLEYGPLEPLEPPC